MKKYYKQLTISIGVALLSTLLFSLIVSAADLTSLRDTISDSRPSQDANHEIQFVTSSGISTSQTITLTFDDAGDAFDLTSVAFGDMDIAEDTDGTPGDCSGTLTDKTLAATATASDWGVNVDTGTDVITLTAPSSGTPVAAGACVVIEIGTNATSGTNQINNPSSAGVYVVDVAGTMTDSGSALVAIVNTVTAEVTVDETLTFTVAAVNSGDCTGGDITTTATSIPFGSPSANTFVDGCQSLTVSTNASSGYSVTVAENQELTNANLDTIPDGTCDGACSISSEGAWATATNNGFGYCLEDVTGTDANATNQCTSGTPGYRIIAELGAETPQTIMSNTGTVNSNAVEVNFRLSVPGDQPAGVYNNNIVYVATPTY